MLTGEINIWSYLMHFPYLGLFILLILGGIGLPVPEDTVLILCGFLISAGVVRPYYAIPVVYAGVLIGDLIIYSFGRKYGRRVITNKRFHKILPPGRLASLEERFHKRGGLVIILGRHLIGFRVQIFLAAGILRMSMLKFFLLDAFTSVFTIVLMVGAGWMGGESFNRLKKDITRIEHMAILAVVIFLAAYLAYLWYKSGQGEEGED